MTNRIAWDLKKKAERDRLLAERKIKEKVGKIYTKWKQQLLGKSGPRKSLAEFTAQLRTDVLNELSESGLDAFQDYTEKLLNEVVDRVQRAESFGMLEGHAKDVAEKALTKTRPNRIRLAFPSKEVVPFHAEEELYQVRQINEAMHQEGFGGLVIGQQLTLWAVLIGPNSQLSFVQLGQCVSSKGIGKFPTLEEFLKAAGKLDDNSEGKSIDT